MNNTLIVYASDHGTVEKCARELFQLLEGKVDMCDLEQREFIPDLTTYDSIIVGGSIHSGKIQDVIASFCDDYLDLLAGKRLGLFINCLYSGSKAEQQLDEAFPAALRQKAVVRDYFGGEVDELKLSFWERIITKQMIEKEDLVVALSKEKIERFANMISTANEGEQ
ncbi:MAG: flavodoxin domain-containing protein [Proteiniphilum sp.]|nr:flavodoxin domain-containing protein [Proteiniphilum sp.]